MRRATAPAICRVSTSTPSGVSMTTVERSFSVLALGQPCFHEVTVVVGYLFNGAVHRIPVGMYVNDAHEDRDHQPAVMEVFVFVHFFNDYDFAVSRSDDYLFLYPFRKVGLDSGRS